jgi:LacI family transcriptional regulator
VTLQQIATHCGVTKGTVSLALRGHPSITAATTARIVEAARELGYNPALHDAARRLAMLRKNERVLSRVIALYFVQDVITSFNGFFGRMFSGVMDGLQQGGFGLLVDYLPRDNSETRLLPIFERSDVDGVLIFGRSPEAPRLIKRLRANPGFGDRPIISLVAELADASSIDTDDEVSTQEIVRHLLALGHTHICHCMYTIWREDDVPSPVDRIGGARKALDEAGLDPAVHLHLLETDSSWSNPALLPRSYQIDDQAFQEDATSQKLLALIREHPEITAFIGLNDSCAFRLWQALHATGYRVPEDYSIVGFDDTEFVLNQSGANLLTTVHIPLYELGREAARRIIDQVSHHRIAYEHVLLPTELIVRDSTGPARR